MAGDGSGGEVMGAAELKPLLLLSRRKPVPCAVGLTKDRQGVLLLHKRIKPRKLMAELLRQAKGADMELDRASVRFGRANVDGGSDSSTVHVSINKDAPGGLRMALVAKLRPAGFQRCEITVDSALEQESDEDEPEGDGADAPRAAAPASEGDGAAATLRGRLTGLVRRAVERQGAAGPGDPAVKATAVAARDALASGNLVAAGQATDRLEALLGGLPFPGTAPGGPAGRGSDPAATGLDAGREQAGLRPAAPTAFIAPGGAAAELLVTPVRFSAPQGGADVAPAWESGPQAAEPGAPGRTPPVAGFLAPTAPSVLEKLAGRVLAVVLSGEAAAAAAGTAFVAMLVVPTNARSVTSGAGVDGHPELGGELKRAPGSISGVLTIRAVGGPGQPAGDPVTLQVDAQLELHRDDGSGPVMGRLSDRTVTLTPAGEAYLLSRRGSPMPSGRAEGAAGVAQPGPGPSAPPQAGSGGNTGRLPPGPPPNVRQDGECDEDANMGPTLPKPRLPDPKTGAWKNADGSPGRAGDSLWFSNNQDVQAVTGGKGVQFANGRPDFTQWARRSINLPYGKLTGKRTDARTVYEAMSRADPSNFPTPAEARRWVGQNDLTPHHATDTCIQLVPNKLNELVPHIGSAADMRASPPITGSQSPNAASQGGQP